MLVDIFLTAKEISAECLRGKTAVIIDTLRATSTIVTALANGALAVEPMAEVEEALQKGRELEKGAYLLCGEREGVKIEGFDLGNSPLEYSPEVVYNKKVILSTTNGTLTIRRAALAEQVLIGSLLNLDAVMEQIKSLGLDLSLCCSGTKGHFSLEDFVTAGAMISYLYRSGVALSGDDRVSTARLLYDRYEDDLIELMSCSQNGSRLMEIGHYSDIEFCARKNMFATVCYFDGQIIYS